MSCTSRIESHGAVVSLQNYQVTPAIPMADHLFCPRPMSSNLFFHQDTGANIARDMGALAGCETVDTNVLFPIDLRKKLGLQSDCIHRWFRCLLHKAFSQAVFWIAVKFPINQVWDSKIKDENQVRFWNTSYFHIFLPLLTIIKAQVPFINTFMHLPNSSNSFAVARQYPERDPLWPGSHWLGESIRACTQGFFGMKAWRFART